MKIDKIQTAAAELIKTLTTGGAAPPLEVLEVLAGGLHRQEAGKDIAFEISERRRKADPPPIIVSDGKIKPMPAEAAKIYGKYLCRQLAYIKAIAALILK